MNRRRHFTCVDLKNGERKWKGGRYGKGQVLLLENSGLLLVSAEDGRVVLLRADASEHAEVASFAALEGKTWNHLVWSATGSTFGTLGGGLLSIAAGRSENDCARL